MCLLPDAELERGVNHDQQGDRFHDPRIHNNSQP
jgi:hypothetical protein